MRRRLKGSILVLTWFCIFAILFQAGCAQRKARPGEVEEPTGLPSGSASPPAIFPHEAGWAQPGAHGDWAFRYGRQPCLNCHKESSEEPESTPTCRSCHPLYPHQGDWVQKTNHGGWVLQNGTSSCATQCHGTDLQGGLTGISCTLCHTVFPHTPTWASPTEHGESAKGDGQTLCQGCHGDDLTGGASGVSCNRCHTNYPHSETWRLPENHGNFVLTNGEGTCATQCHGADLKGGLSGVSCNSCHNLYPHPNAWDDNHGAAATSLGLGACQGCHGTDYSTLLEGQNCYSCHSDFPHNAGWIPYEGGHGEKIQETYGGSLESCKGCHGEDLRRTKNGQNCFSCHLSFPHEILERPPAPAWGTFDGHGNFALVNSKTACQQCHGSDYQGGTRGNPSCTTCHATYPHTGDWGNGGHGDYINLNGTGSCATARCHGTNLIPTVGVTKGTPCASCHTTYPHPAGWISGAIHGPPARAQIANCKTCHGAGLDQVPPGHQTCVQCHPSYLNHQSAGIVSPNNWPTYAGHGSYVMSPPLSGNTSSCQICHGNNYLGGIASVSCRSSGCHPSFPHTQVGWTGYSGHGVYVMSSLGGNTNACKLCHGNDLQGGHSGVSCNTCHASFPHGAGWNLPSSHGVAAYGTGKNSCKTANCHGTNFQGSTYGPSCTTCHADYPHTAPGWMFDNPMPEHTERFIDLIYNEGVETACQECHGANYDRNVGGIQCTMCHPNGVTHTPGWSEGTGHGVYYSTTRNFNSTSEPFCNDCHGHPDLAVNFTDSHTGPTIDTLPEILAEKAFLAGESDCYGCHWAYPHKGYTVPSSSTENWEPASDHYGHILYLVRSPLASTPSGVHPGTSNDPLWDTVLPYTCGGGTGGTCHFDGYRSEPSGSTSKMCGQFCHGASP